MPEGPSIGPRKLAQSDLDIPSAGLTDVSFWARNRHADAIAACLLLRAEPTCPTGGPRSQFDPLCENSKLQRETRMIFLRSILKLNLQFGCLKQS